MLRTLVKVLNCVLALVCALNAQPPRNQFRVTSLMMGLSSPTQFVILPNGKFLVLSKGGAISLHDPIVRTTTNAGTLTVSNVREDGLHSIVLDPNFTTNRQLYLLFGVTTPSQSIVVARFNVLNSDLVDMSSRKDLLTVPYSLGGSDEHNTGCLAFDNDGNLLIALADNTSNFFSGPTTGFSPRDPARPQYDAQRTAANSNDLRGKILRIRPAGNGTYTIPAGNLFATGLNKTRPEIYAMGLRHPFRLTVDSKSGWIYWAEPGPNATNDDPKQGPRGYDIVAMAKAPGNFGWPYCRGNNFCYNTYDYQNNSNGLPYKPDSLRNVSSNNTGIELLPPAKPALIWYPYNATSTAFPIFGNGTANTSMLGPVYYFDRTVSNANKIPLYFDQHLFIFDFSRSLIHAVQMDANGAVVAVKRFWDQNPSNLVNNPMDFKVGSDGAFYILNWGNNGAYPNNSGGGNLVRLDYIGPPDPLVSSSPKSRPRLRPQLILLRDKVGFPKGLNPLVTSDVLGKTWYFPAF